MKELPMRIKVLVHMNRSKPVLMINVPVKDVFYAKRYIRIMFLDRPEGGYKASGSASTCPVNGTDFTSWAVLPALPEGAQNYIDKGAGKALGYSGPSNQGAGGAVRPPSHSPH